MVYSYQEILKKLGSRSNIEKALKSGKIFRLKDGIYSDSDVVNPMIIISKKYTGAIITMDSAFYYYNLTDVIPENWFQHSRNDVGNETKLNSLKVGIDKWGKWEINTKQLYERMYGELISLNEIAAGENLMIFIKDVDNELAEAQQEMLEITTMNYDLNDIMMKQEDIFKTYKKKLKEIEYD